MLELCQLSAALVIESEALSKVLLNRGCFQSPESVARLFELFVDRQKDITSISMTNKQMHRVFHWR